MKLTKQPVPFVIPQIDGQLEINLTDSTSQTSHNNKSDESTQIDDTNKPEPFKGLEGFDYYTLYYDDPDSDSEHS